MGTREPFLGVLLLDGKMASAPGCMAAPASFPYPVVHRVVAGAKGPATEADARALEPAYVAAAQELAAAGAGAITDNCNGRMVHLQQALASAVPVPVLTSALLWVPTLHHLLPGKRIGILTFFAPDLGEWHYQACGWSSQDIPIAVAGVGECQPWLDFLRTKELPADRQAAMARDLIAAARQLQAQHPDLGALVAECTLLPPCSQAVREATGLPVYDLLTLLDFAMAGYRRPACVGA